MKTQRALVTLLRSQLRLCEAARRQNPRRDDPLRPNRPRVYPVRHALVELLPGPLQQRRPHLSPETASGQTHSPKWLSHWGGVAAHGLVVDQGHVELCAKDAWICPPCLLRGHGAVDLVVLGQLRPLVRVVPIANCRDETTRSLRAGPTTASAPGPAGSPVHRWVGWRWRGRGTWVVDADVHRLQHERAHRAALHHPIDHILQVGAAGLGGGAVVEVGVIHRKLDEEHVGAALEHALAEVLHAPLRRWNARGNAQVARQEAGHAVGTEARARAGGPAEGRG
eukprot:COSAG04_NODE_1870_length_5345_cov_9.554878_3_plen_281_part_00